MQVIWSVGSINNNIIIIHLDEILHAYSMFNFWRKCSLARALSSGLHMENKMQIIFKRHTVYFLKCCRSKKKGQTIIIILSLEEYFLYPNYFTFALIKFYVSNFLMKMNTFIAKVIIINFCMSYDQIFLTRKCWIIQFDVECFKIFTTHHLWRL